MSYNIDYFKPENHQLYPQLTLNPEEYHQFIHMCIYLYYRLRGYWSYFVFQNSGFGVDYVILDNQMISTITSLTEMIVIEKFYYKIYFKYLEEKLNELK